MYGKELPSAREAFTRSSQSIRQTSPETEEIGFCATPGDDSALRQMDFIYTKWSGMFRDGQKCKDAGPVRC